MAITKAFDNSREFSPEEDRRYRQVMAEFDEIFERGRKEVAESDGISFKDYIKEIGTRLNESKV